MKIADKFVLLIALLPMFGNATNSGKDNGLPVSRSYQNKLPFGFTGTINKVSFDLGALH